jgi:hypothetical protein
MKCKFIQLFQLVNKRLTYFDEGGSTKNAPFEWMFKRRVFCIGG